MPQAARQSNFSERLRLVLSTKPSELAPASTTDFFESFEIDGANFVKKPRIATTWLRRSKTLTPILLPRLPCNGETVRPVLDPAPPSRVSCRAAITFNSAKARCPENLAATGAAEPRNRDIMPLPFVHGHPI
jgi:hypothetical protein